MTKYTTEEATEIVANWAKKGAFEPTSEELKIFIEELKNGGKNVLFPTPESWKKIGEIEGKK